MKEKKITYYLVWKRMVAKREQGEKSYEDYILKNGKWILDEAHIIMDHLVGYDPCEPEDSPYRIGSTSVLLEMEKISEKRAIAVMNQQILTIMKEYGATDIFSCGFLD